MIDMQKVEILGIPVFAGPLDHAIDCVIEQCIAPAREMNLRISATGAHGLVTARKNPEFRETLKSCFLNLPDGMLVVSLKRPHQYHWVLPVTFFPLSGNIPIRKDNA